LKQIEKASFWSSTRQEKRSRGEAVEKALDEANSGGAMRHVEFELILPAVKTRETDGANQ
jgi:hypothetical protein